jgi:hypothetical protein
MAKKREEMWILSDREAETIRARPVLLRRLSGEIIPGALEVEKANGRKMVVRVEYNAANPPGRVTLQRSVGPKGKTVVSKPCFYLAQEQFDLLSSSNFSSVLDIPNES